MVPMECGKSLLKHGFVYGVFSMNGGWDYRIFIHIHDPIPKGIYPWSRHKKHSEPPPLTTVWTSWRLLLGSENARPKAGVCYTICRYLQSHRLMVSTLLNIPWNGKKWWYPNSWKVYNGKSYVKWMMTGGVPMSGNLQIYMSKKYLWYQHMCLQKMWHEPSISGLCGRENDKPWEGMVVWILRQPPLPKLNIIIYL